MAKFIILNFDETDRFRLTTERPDLSLSASTFNPAQPGVFFLPAESEAIFIQLIGLNPVKDLGHDAAAALARFADAGGKVVCFIGPSDQAELAKLIGSFPELHFQPNSLPESIFFNPEEPFQTVFEQFQMSISHAYKLLTAALTDDSWEGSPKLSRPASILAKSSDGCPIALSLSHGRGAYILLPWFGTNNIDVVSSLIGAFEKKAVPEAEVIPPAKAEPAPAEPSKTAAARPPAAPEPVIPEIPRPAPQPRMPLVTKPEPGKEKGEEKKKEERESPEVAAGPPVADMEPLILDLLGPSPKPAIILLTKPEPEKEKEIEKKEEREKKKEETPEVAAGPPVADMEPIVLNIPGPSPKPAMTPLTKPEPEKEEEKEKKEEREKKKEETPEVAVAPPDVDLAPEIPTPSKPEPEPEEAPQTATAATLPDIEPIVLRPTEPETPPTDVPDLSAAPSATDQEPPLPEIPGPPAEPEIVPVAEPEPAPFPLPSVEPKSDQMPEKLPVPSIPDLVAGREEAAWLEQEEYAFPELKEIYAQREEETQRYAQARQEIEERHARAMEAIEQRLQAFKASGQEAFLNVLRSEGRDLVQAVIFVLKYLGWSRVIDVHDYWKKVIRPKEEEIWILESESPSVEAALMRDKLLLVLVRSGEAGATDEECALLQRYKGRRMQEYNNTQMRALLIGNYFMTTEGRSRTNPFTPAQVEEAQKDGNALLSTYDLFQAIKAEKEGRVTKDELRRRIGETIGLIQFEP